MSAKFQMISDGKRTYAQLGGKLIGRGITGLSYTHDAAGHIVSLHLDIDLADFEFIDDDYEKTAAIIRSLPDRKAPDYMEQLLDKTMDGK